MNFAVLWLFVQVNSAKFGGVVFFAWSNSRKSYFSPIHESFLPRKFPTVRYHSIHSIPQYIRVYHSIHSISQYTTVYHSVLQYSTVFHSVLQYSIVYQSIPQYTTVYHSIPQYTTVCHSTSSLSYCSMLPERESCTCH